MNNTTTAVVVGASGGLGAALVGALHSSGEFAKIYAFSRTSRPRDDGVVGGVMDITIEPSIAAAAALVAEPLDLVIVATGLLHETGRMPEKSLQHLDADALQRLFAVNTIGPALAMKHFAPRLARDRRAILAVLSARVGSISDNRTGGWYGYRASKAALNMMVRSAAIELGRTRPLSVCVALHPGTVDTALSKPFQSRVADGKLFSPDLAAQHLLRVMRSLDHSATGRIYAWDGSEIAP